MTCAQEQPAIQQRTLKTATKRKVRAPLARQFGYEVVRIDDIKDSGNINQQILENIAQSSLILADLSGEQPNLLLTVPYSYRDMAFWSRER